MMAAVDPIQDLDNEYADQEGMAEPFPTDTITSLMAAPARNTLVKGFAGRGELILFYGPPKHGKTFAVSHFAISVAARANWFGRRCKAPQGFVLYCALEGGAGMRNRLKAIRQHDPVLGDQITDRNLFIMRQRIDLRQQRDVDRLIATVAKHERETGTPCLLVIVDTVARALGTGTDADPKDMAALIAAADTIRHAGKQPTVALIHHAGKDIARGPRGRSDLPGAIDTCILVERLENGAGNRATCEYAKDDPDGWAIDFRLEQVELGKDADGDPITTCVVREGEAHRAAPAKRKRGDLSVMQALAIQALRDEAETSKRWDFSFADAQTLWIRRGVIATGADEAGLRKRAFRLRQQLANRRLVKIDNNLIRLILR